MEKMKLSSLTGDLKLKKNIYYVRSAFSAKCEILTKGIKYNFSMKGSKFSVTFLSQVLKNGKVEPKLGFVVVVFYASNCTLCTIYIF